MAALVCGWDTSTVYSLYESRCGKPAKYRTNYDSTNNELACGTHANVVRRRMQWDDTLTVIPIEGN